MNENEFFTQDELTAIKGHILSAIERLNNETYKKRKVMFLSEAATEELLNAIDKEVKKHSKSEAINLHF